VPKSRSAATAAGAIGTNAREARHWVEQTLADWIEWRDCEIKKRFRFTASQRRIMTTIIVGGGLGALVLLGAFDVARSAFKDAWARARPAPAVTSLPKVTAHPDCRDLVRGYRVFGRVSAYPPLSAWWGQSTHIVWVYDDGRLP
jgi:hypothetical protein